MIKVRLLVLVLSLLVIGCESKTKKMETEVRKTLIGNWYLENDVLLTIKGNKFYVYGYGDELLAKGTYGINFGDNGNHVFDMKYEFKKNDDIETYKVPIEIIDKYKILFNNTVANRAD